MVDGSFSGEDVIALTIVIAMSPTDLTPLVHLHLIIFICIYFDFPPSSPDKSMWEVILALVLINFKFLPKFVLRYIVLVSAFRSAG